MFIALQLARSRYNTACLCMCYVLRPLSGVHTCHNRPSLLKISCLLRCNCLWSFDKSADLSQEHADPIFRACIQLRYLPRLIEPSVLRVMSPLVIVLPGLRPFLLLCAYAKVVRFEVSTAGTMENAVFWNVTPCSSCKNRRFGGTYRHHHQSESITS
jgi:hypothetical protein